MGNVIKKLGELNRSLNKTDIVNLAKENTQILIDSQKYDLLRVYIEIKRYELYLKTVIEDLKIHAELESFKQDKKTFNYDNAKISIREVTKWQFNLDAEWREIEKEVQMLLEMRKKREVYLKENSEKIQIIDEITGEVLNFDTVAKSKRKGIAIVLPN